MNTIYEILEKANNYKQPVRRVKYLKDNNSLVLRTILHGNFSKNVNFKMPQGAPPYTPNEDAVHDDKEYERLRQLFNFKEHQWAREKRFSELLGAIPAKDAEIIVAMKDGKITELFPNITEEIFNKIWPNLK